MTEDSYKKVSIEEIDANSLNQRVDNFLIGKFKDLPKNISASSSFDIDVWKSNKFLPIPATSDKLVPKLLVTASAPAIFCKLNPKFALICPYYWTIKEGGQRFSKSSPLRAPPQIWSKN